MERETRLVFYGSHRSSPKENERQAHTVDVDRVRGSSTSHGRDVEVQGDLVVVHFGAGDLHQDGLVCCGPFAPGDVATGRNPHSELCITYACAHAG